MSAKLLIKVTENKDGLSVWMDARKNWLASKKEKDAVTFIRTIMHEILIQLKEKQDQP
jgi:hypothetical protein